jgi:hypothetical protein
MVKKNLKAQIENIKNALLQSFTLTMKKPGNNRNLVLLIILQQTIGCSKERNLSSSLPQN